MKFDTGSARTTALTIDFNQDVSIPNGTLGVTGDTTVANKIQANQNQAGVNGLVSYCTNASFTGTTLQLQTIKAAAADFNLITAYTSNGGVLGFSVNGQGNVYAAGALDVTKDLKLAFNGTRPTAWDTNSYVWSKSGADSGLHLDGYRVILSSGAVEAVTLEADINNNVSIPNGTININNGGTAIAVPANVQAVVQDTSGFANVGLALVSGTGNSCSLFMGDPADPKIGELRYANATDTFSLSKTLDVAGAVNKTGGTFKIDHPLPEKADTHHLVHSFTESPQADLLYSGTSELVDGAAEVNLDEFHGMTEGTFVALNRNIRVFTTNESDWEPIKGSVTGNILSISCQNASCSDKVSWMVIGERQDEGIKSLDFTDEQGRVIVEPLKPEVLEGNV